MTFSQITTPPQHSNVIIVGGGPSLTGLDLRALCGNSCFYVLAINNAAWKLPNAGGCITADVRWAEHYSKRLTQEFNGDKFVVVPDDCDLQTWAGITYLRQSTEQGISDRADTVRVRGTSGYAAINVACLLGAKRIWLLGFDMAAPGKHWFGSYPWSSATDEAIYASWCAEFDYLAKVLCSCGVSVNNVGMGSKLQSFPKGDITGFLRWAHAQNRHSNNRQ